MKRPSLERLYCLVIPPFAVTRHHKDASFDVHLLKGMFGEKERKKEKGKHVIRVLSLHVIKG
jgi:hypothetical protein